MELVLVVVTNFGLGARFTHLSFRQFHFVHTRQYEVLPGTVRFNKADRQLGILCMVTVPLHLSVGGTRWSRRINSPVRSAVRDNNDPLFQSQN
jgi:hypothetical protein